MKMVTSFLRKAILSVFYLGTSLAYGAGIAGNDPYDFTDDERREFQDAPDRFPRTTLPHLIPYGHVFWIDNEHIIMAVRELPDGWNAKTMPVPVSDISPVQHPPQGVSRIISVTTSAGKIADAPYPGELVCFADGKIVVGIPAEAGAYPDYFYGQYGSRLDKLDLKRGERPNNLTGVACSQRDNDVARISLTYHLLPEHGTLSFTPDPSRSWMSETALHLTDPQDHLIATLDVTSDSKPGNLRYLSYANQYAIETIISDQTAHSGLLLSPDGHFLYIDSDPFLSYLVRKHHFSGGVKVTKVGVFWNLQASPAYIKQQGLFFRENGKLLRLDDGIIGGLAVSPDGCRLFYDRTGGKDILNLVRRSLVVLDVCAPDRR